MTDDKGDRESRDKKPKPEEAGARPVFHRKTGFTISFDKPPPPAKPKTTKK